MPRVLIVEDDSGIAHLLGTLLRFEGYEVQVAKDREEVMSAVETDPPDLAIIDVHLKAGDGFEVLGQIRALPDPRASQTAVLMMSGMDYRYRCKSAGADGFLEKPFDRQRLLEVLDQVQRRVAARGGD